MDNSVSIFERKLIKMSSIRRFIISFLLMGSIETVRPVMPSTGELSFVQHWSDSAFAQEISALPFSFVYDGQSSSNFLTNWVRTQSLRVINETRRERTVTFNDLKTGLEIRCMVVEYNDFPTVEWTLYFKNTGAEDTPILSNVQALDIRLQRDSATEFLLHHATGSPANLTDFAPHQTLLPQNAVKRFQGEGGRPTSADWPYFNLEDGISRA